MVKKELSPEVYLAGLRTYKSESLDRAPREGTESSYIEKLWSFLERLVGMGNSVNNKISRIDIFYNGRNTECECGAILPTVGANADTEEKLREPCTCRGAQGIVEFQVAKAAVILRGIIKTHKNLHRDGQKEQVGYAADKSIELCETCCFNNKKIKCTTVRPVEHPEEENEGVDTEEESSADIEGHSEDSQTITEQQLSAAAVILNGILGAPLILQTSTLITGIKGENLTDAYTSIVAGVREIFQNPQNATALPKKFAPDDYKNAVSTALSDVVTNISSEDRVQKATEWITLFTDSNDGKVEMPQEQEDGNGGNGADGSALMAEDDDFTGEISEQEVTKLHESIAPLLVVCNEMDIDTMGETTAAEVTLKKLQKTKVRATSIFIGLDFEVQNRLSDEQSKNMGVLSEAIRKLQGQINLFKFTKGDVHRLVEAEKTKSTADKGHELPTKTEINQDITPLLPITFA